MGMNAKSVMNLMVIQGAKLEIFLAGPFGST